MANSWWVVEYHLATASILPGFLTPPGQHLSSVVQALSSAAASQQITSKIHGGNTHAVVDKVLGPFATQQQAQGSEPGQSIGATGPAGLAQSLGSTFLGPLFQANLWERVGEVVLGLVLIAIGVARLTHAVPIATKIAGAVA